MFSSFGSGGIARLSWLRRIGERCSGCTERWRSAIVEYHPDMGRLRLGLSSDSLGRLRPEPIRLLPALLGRLLRSPALLAWLLRWWLLPVFGANGTGMGTDRQVFP